MHRLMKRSLSGIPIAGVVIAAIIAVRSAPPPTPAPPFSDLKSVKTSNELVHNYNLLLHEFNRYTDEQLLAGIAYYTEQLETLDKASDERLLINLRRGACYLALGRLDEWPKELDPKPQQPHPFTLNHLTDSFRTCLVKKQSEPAQRSIVAELSSLWMEQHKQL